jgi:hypothetical protein
MADAGKTEVYQFTVLPQPLRVQVVHILREAIGEYTESNTQYYPNAQLVNDARTTIHKMIIKEHGVFYLREDGLNPFLDCVNFVLNGPIDRCLDLIELSVRWIDRMCRHQQHHSLDADDAITELNHRFKEHGVGFEYVAGELVQISSEFIHAEVVKPAIALLQKNGFAGAQDEFLAAHEHFRKGRYKESVTEALKAFESTMKCIAKKRRWQVDATATASRLIDALFSKNLISPELQSEFGALKSLLATGLPTVRNRQSGHGQGATVIEMPEHVAAFALHMAAANIVFIASADIANP